MKNKWLFFALFISLITGAALFTTNHFRTHDDIQVFRLNEYLACWQDSQIPCRWSSELGKGYGYPYFIFYPPMIYIIPAIIHWTAGLSLITSLNLSALLTFPLAAYSMFRLVREVTGRDDAAGVSSVLFILAPYHAVNVFVRGVYAENLAWSLVPLIIAWTIGYMKRGKAKVKSILGIAALILTHNISAMLFLPVILIASLISGFNANKFRWLGLFNIFLLGIGVSAWFLIPALFEKKLVQTSTMITGYYSYLNHFVSLGQVFISNFWGYGASGYETQADGMSFALGYHLVLVLIIAGVVLLRNRLHFKRHLLTIFFLFLALLALFMTHAKSVFLWQMLPTLQYIQFPWRFLGVASMSLAAVAGFTLVLIPVKYFKVIAFSMMLIAAALYLPRFRPEKFDNYKDTDFLLGELKNAQATDHIFDYLPKTVKVVPSDPRVNEITETEKPISRMEISHSSKQLDLVSESNYEQTYTFSVFDYPGWVTKIDGVVQAHNPDPDSGLIETKVPAGNHHIELSFSETKLRLIADILSVLAFTVTLILGFKSKYSASVRSHVQ